MSSLLIKCDKWQCYSKASVARERPFPAKGDYIALCPRHFAGLKRSYAKGDAGEYTSIDGVGGEKARAWFAKKAAEKAKRDREKAAAQAIRQAEHDAAWTERYAVEAAVEWTVSIATYAGRKVRIVHPVGEPALADGGYPNGVQVYAEEHYGGMTIRQTGFSTAETPRRALAMAQALIATAAEAGI